MGRHSIPGPDDSADDYQDPGRRDSGPVEPDASPLGRFGYEDETGDGGAAPGDGFFAGGPGEPDEPPTRALTTTGSSACAPNDRHPAVAPHAKQSNE